MFECSYQTLIQKGKHREQRNPTSKHHHIHIRLRPAHNRNERSPQTWRLSNEWKNRFLLFDAHVTVPHSLVIPCAAASNHPKTETRCQLTLCHSRTGTVACGCELANAVHSWNALEIKWKFPPDEEHTYPKWIAGSVCVCVVFSLSAFTQDNDHIILLEWIDLCRGTSSLFSHYNN